MSEKISLDSSALSYAIHHIICKDNAFYLFNDVLKIILHEH